MQLLARRGKVGHQGSSLSLADLAEFGHDRDSHLCDTQLQQDHHLAFAGTDIGIIHVNPEGGWRVCGRV